MHLIVTRRKDCKSHPLIPGGVMGLGKGDWLHQGIHPGIRKPWWPNARGAQFYVFDSSSWDGRNLSITVPAMLIEGYNHCTPGWKVEVKLDFLEKAIQWIETLIWKKGIWAERDRERQYQNRVAEYNHNFYYQTNPYYKKKVDYENMVREFAVKNSVTLEQAEEILARNQEKEKQ